MADPSEEEIDGSQWRAPAQSRTGPAVGHLHDTAFSWHASLATSARTSASGDMGCGVLRLAIDVSFVVMCPLGSATQEMQKADDLLFAAASSQRSYAIAATGCNGPLHDDLAILAVVELTMGAGCELAKLARSLGSC